MVRPIVGQTGGKEYGGFSSLTELRIHFMSPNVQTSAKTHSRDTAAAHEIVGSNLKSLFWRVTYPL